MSIGNFPRDHRRNYHVVLAFGVSRGRRPRDLVANFASFLGAEVLNAYDFGLLERTCYVVATPNAKAEGALEPANLENKFHHN
jgi:hypothetical protein